MISIRSLCPTTPFRSQRRAGRKKQKKTKQLFLFEWCLSNNWATLLPVRSGRGMSGRVWGKVWDLNLYCFLHIKLQFVCLRSTLTASRPISHQCPHGVISDFEPFDRGDNGWAIICASRGCVPVSLGCTWAHNQDTDAYVHKRAMNPPPPESGITKQLIIWRVLSYHGNAHCSSAEGLYGKWMITKWGRACVCFVWGRYQWAACMFVASRLRVIGLSLWPVFLLWKKKKEQKRI